jgi:hypothetical protein
MFSLCPVFDLHGSLAVDTGGATAARHHVSTGAALNVPLIPGLLPEQQGGDAGQETSQETAEEAGLTQALSVGVDLAGHAPQATATSAEVGAWTAEMLVKLVDRHAGFYDGSLDFLIQEYILNSQQGSKTHINSVWLRESL